MGKTVTILATKRANRRLSPVADVCLAIANKHHHRSLDKERKLMLARLDREITPEDQAGPALRQAVEAFWQGVDGNQPLAPLAKTASFAVGRVQWDRWRRIEAKYGRIHHYFDRFGQIKPRYRMKRGVEPVKKPRWWVLIAGVVV